MRIFGSEVESRPSVSRVNEIERKNGTGTEIMHEQEHTARTGRHTKEIIDMSAATIDYVVHTHGRSYPNNQSHGFDTTTTTKRKILQSIDTDARLGFAPKTKKFPFLRIVPVNRYDFK